MVYVPEGEPEGEATEEGGNVEGAELVGESGQAVTGEINENDREQGADQSGMEQENGEEPEIDQNGNDVYDIEPSPTPTPDPRDAWFDSIYNQNRN